MNPPLPQFTPHMRRGRAEGTPPLLKCRLRLGKGPETVPGKVVEGGRKQNQTKQAAF